METISEKYHQVLENIACTALKAGRDPAAVRLVVVTKGHPLESVRSVVAAGARMLGENYIEEAVPKISALQNYPELEWHMIGHLQSRKARSVCDYFTWLHSLDSIKLASRLNRFAHELNRTLPCLLECNVSGEQTKSGWKAWEQADWSRLANELEPLRDLEKIKIHGLMTMAPYLPDPEETRPYFKRLRMLRDFLAIRLGWADWSELSMGMSADYIIAIQEQATFVRIGTAILGERTTT
jgi:pyridoxal phosphate enzyme (YggS family)